MKCKVCGAESGKYPFCVTCNSKREAGTIIKCERCGMWHNRVDQCQICVPTSIDDDFLYCKKPSLISKSEDKFFLAIKESLPAGYFVFPQINLASFIDRTDNSRYRNELYRNVDFLVTDGEYVPVVVIEINDQTHLNNDRKERDEKVRKICEEAGVPIIKLWTSYGVNPEYIKTKIYETLEKMPVERVHHFNQDSRMSAQQLENTDPAACVSSEPAKRSMRQASKQGCYIATCVYGSYDCPQVWVLRRYRDYTLANTWYGRLFIKGYYAVSPRLVKWFGHTSWFASLFKNRLDTLVEKLLKKGVSCLPYRDLNT